MSEFTPIQTSENADDLYKAMYGGIKESVHFPKALVQIAGSNNAAWLLNRIIWHSRNKNGAPFYKFK